MLQNAYFDYFLAKIGADTAENEQHFAEILPKPAREETLRAVGPQGPGLPSDEDDARLGAALDCFDLGKKLSQSSARARSRITSLF